MPNYYLDRGNQIIDNADGIYAFLSGDYVRRYRDNGTIIDYGQEIVPFDGLRFIHVLSYEKTEGNEKSRELMLKAMHSAVSGYYSQNKAVGMILVSNGTECSLYFMTEEPSRAGFEKHIQDITPNLQWKNQFVSTAELRNMSSYGGFIINVPAIQEDFIDNIMNGLSGKRGAVAFVAYPADFSQAQNYYTGLTYLKEDVESLQQAVSNTFGNASKRTFQQPTPELGNLYRYLSTQIERWDVTQELWSSCACFATEDAYSAEALGNVIVGSLDTASSQARAGRCMALRTITTRFKSGVFGVPSMLLPEDPVERLLPGGLLKSPLMTYLSTGELASLFQMPQYSHPGIRIEDNSDEVSRIRPFSVNAVTQAKNGIIRLGAITETGGDFSIRLKDVNEHVLVTGATGSGKTNTVKNIVRGLYENKIHVCVIEPAKKDYWRLLQDVPELKVYSAGDDARPLYLDIFTPEAGMVISSHIDSVLYAFSGAFEMEEPTRLALSGLIKYAYMRCGWTLAEPYRPRRHPVPSVPQLLEWLSDYMATEVQYGREVQGNVRGSLMNRLQSLRDGTAGTILRCENGKPLTGKDLCTGAVLIELEDLTIDVKPFIAEILLVKIDQYLRRKDASDELKNVIILEEAHNIFPNIPISEKRTSKSLTSDYFSNMLSQIREYGTGIVIADQGASQINATAVGNTKVKIAHSMSREEDVNALSLPLRLDDYKRRIIPTLPTGQALVAIRGQSDVWRVQVNEVKETGLRNMACLFCGESFNCDFDGLSASVSPRSSRLSIYAAEILNAYDEGEDIRKIVERVSHQIGAPVESGLCLLGMLLDKGNASVGDREKRRILYTYTSDQER